MGFKESCCCCCAPVRVVPVPMEEFQKPLNAKQKKIMEYVGDGVMVDEIFEYIETEKKKKSRFRFRGLGRLAGGRALQAPSESPEIRRKTFKQVGRATQMGVIANSKKKSAIEEDDDEYERPRKKWTFKSVGKVTRLKSSKPFRSRVKWTFKRIANFIRFGPDAPVNTEIVEALEEKQEMEKKKWTLKSLGKMSKMGGFKREVEKPKQKFTLKGLGKMSKLGLFKNESEEKPKSQKFSLKGLGKLSKKLGFGGGKTAKQNTSIEVAAPPKRRKTLKAFAKANILGGKVSQTEKANPKAKPKKKWTFKSLGKISKLGVAATSKKPKKKKRVWTLKSLIRTTQVGVAATRPRKMKRKKKPPTFRFLARFSRFGAREPVCTCGENAEDLYECTCSDSDED